MSEVLEKDAVITVEQWRGFVERLNRAVAQTELLLGMQDWRKFELKLKIFNDAQTILERYNVEHFGEDKTLKPIIDYLTELDERVANWDHSNDSKALYFEGLTMATEELRLYVSYLVPSAGKKEDWPWY